MTSQQDNIGFVKFRRIFLGFLLLTVAGSDINQRPVLAAIMDRLLVQVNDLKYDLLGCYIR